MVVKKELIEDINTLIDEMRSDYPNVQRKLNENGLREKISKQFSCPIKSDSRSTEY